MAAIEIPALAGDWVEDCEAIALFRVLLKDFAGSEQVGVAVATPRQFLNLIRGKP